MPGERIALLGPNGSGKSTLLRTLSGLIKPLKGDIEINGIPIKRQSARQIAQAIAIIPQEEVPPFAFTVRQFVTMGRLPFGNGILDTPEDAELTDKAMITAECRHLADRSVMELSGGERQRVLIARAIAQGSPIWLMDEPTSHLDIAHQLQVATLVRDQPPNRSVVAAIHDLNQASRMADRGILLDDGRIVKDAPLAEILESQELERVFRVRFDQLQNPAGRTVLSPRG